jgi:hypothetical protein
MDPQIQILLSRNKPDLHRAPSSPSRRYSTTLRVSYYLNILDHNGLLILTNFRLIVSIPIDLSEHKELQKFEEKGERAYYVSVEQVKQLENGKVEWRMATSSDIGGLIPKFAQEMSMPKSIAEVCISGLAESIFVNQGPPNIGRSTLPPLVQAAS